MSGTETLGADDLRTLLTQAGYDGGGNVGLVDFLVLVRVMGASETRGTTSTPVADAGPTGPLIMGPAHAFNRVGTKLTA